MESKQIHKIKHLLNSSVFCNDLIDVKAVTKQIQTSDCLRIMYGETYDVFGLTFDSLKYYLLLEYLKRQIESVGVSVESVLLVGDIASIRNENVTDKEGMLKTIQQNIETIKGLKKKYHLSFEILVMSEVFRSKDFDKKLTAVSAFAKDNKEIEDLLVKTILQNRLKQELELGFRYALEEIAIISDYDLKIGPPREQYYDKASQIYKKSKPYGLYVKPTYPLGLNYDYFINHPEIEEFGLTPYKAGSNKLQRNRVILKVTSKEQLEQLIKMSFEPKYEDLPNPLKDLYTTYALSKAIRTNTELDANFKDYSSGSLYKLLIDEFNEYFAN